MWGFSALIDRITPRQPTEDATDRARFLAQVWVIAGLVWLVYLPLNLSSNMWGQVALSFVLVVASVVLILLLWRGVQLNVVVHLSLGTLTLAFGAAALMQRPFDATNLVALTLVPVMASYLVGRHSGRWLGAVILSGASSYALGLMGFTVPDVDPHPEVSQALNLGLTVLVAWVLTRRFDALRRASVARLEEADRAKNVFLATVGHEIRTPMNGVLGMTEVMLSEPQSARQREQLEVIHRSGKGLVSLLNDLLDLTRLEAGKLNVDVGVMDLDAVIHDADALARPQARHKDLGFGVDRAPDVPRRVMGDGLRVSQVLNNLLNNAIKFTDRGEVRLGVAVHGGQLVFSVRDTGPGITPEDRARLFRPFAQLDGTSRRRHGGSGLGLAITRQLVELMGGRLELESTPGQGSTFHARLPLVAAVGVERAPAIAASTAPASGAQVLVVDDNPINLKVATAMVEKAGFHALAASSGAQALELFAAERVSLVLMDCHMPGMDGFETTRRLREGQQDGAHLPIIALTASAGPDDVEACHQAGMDECLAKPARLDVLTDVLRRYLARSAPAA